MFDFLKSKKDEEIKTLSRRVSNLSHHIAKLSQARAFDAARADRLSADWPTISGNPEYDIYAALDVLRTRARERCQNDGYAKRVVDMFQFNIVGPYGFKLKSKAVNANDSLDEPGNKAVQDAWMDFAKPINCSTTARESLTKICTLSIGALPRDGEYIIRRVRRKEYKYGIALQMILPEHLNVRKNERLGNGHIVRMGVELDEFDRPCAYWIRKADKEMELYVTSNYGGEYERIPAEDIIHNFVADYPNQTRGIPLLAPGLITLKNIGGFDEAVLYAARAGASSMLFLKNQKNDEPTQYKGTDKDAEGNTVVSWEPASIQDLGDKELAPFIPEFPNGEHAPFAKIMLRRVAGSVGVSYEGLANDRESVNYSSIRAGLIEERELWKGLQEWFLETTLDRIFGWWLEEALFKGAIKMQSGTPLPVKVFDKFNNPYFIGKRWDWVDPEKDISAVGKSIEMGQNSPRRAAAEKGDDFKELIDEIADDMAYAKLKGVELNFGSKTPPKQKPNDNNPQVNQ